MIYHHVLAVLYNLPYFLCMTFERHISSHSSETYHQHSSHLTHLPPMHDLFRLKNSHLNAHRSYYNRQTQTPSILGNWLQNQYLFPLHHCSCCLFVYRFEIHLKIKVTSVNYRFITKFFQYNPIGKKAKLKKVLLHLLTFCSIV